MSLYTYPSNKLEYLVKILSKLLDKDHKNIFTPINLIIANYNIKSWLNMELANNRRIAMNIKYNTINNYILNICYKITNKEQYKKAYTKNILIWRIFKKLDKINYYKLKEYYQNNVFKKYQLSVKIAEVFFKYLLYCNDWLISWEKNKFINLSNPIDNEYWQMKLYQELILEVPDTPYKVEIEAIKKLNKISLKKINISNNIYIFGINTISSNHLKFIFKLAKYVDLHILYINPCTEYFYNLNKNKFLLWLNNDNFEEQPILKNLGCRVKELFKELLFHEKKQNIKNLNYLNTDELNFIKLKDLNQTQLISIQRNLLELNCKNYTKEKDLTISINSCYSEFREIQVLYDKLLDIMKVDSNIKPRDILVICPNIKDYVVYINSVFSTSFGNETLPYYIADLGLIDSEYLVTAFIDLLYLPDDNFDVNKILYYLSIPEIQYKFKIFDEHIDTIKYWLKEACIYHGKGNQLFSWNLGLKRLILGFCYGDDEYIVNDELITLPIINGSEIIELGKLYQLIECLENFSKNLNKKKTFVAWKNYLLEIFDNIFYIFDKDYNIAKIIKDIIIKTLTQASNIIPSEEIDLYLIRDCLISELSKPFLNNYFLKGKITFCSILPMRSIPFKVIAILGLNSDKFPRKDKYFIFDLISKFSKKNNYINSNNDDRYLFLELILSARNYLYISYISWSSKTNKKLQPSIVVKELITYLKFNYNFYTKEDELKDRQELKIKRRNIISDIKEYPLQPFNSKCYSNEYRSYNKFYLRLLSTKSVSFYNKKKLLVKDIINNYKYQKKIYNNICLNLNIKYMNNSSYIKLLNNFTVSKLVKIFDNPLKAFANYCLDLYLENSNVEYIDSSEPFDIDHLIEYNLKKELINALKNNQDKGLIVQIIKLSGKFPESIFTDIMIDAEIKNINNLLNNINLSKYINKNTSISILGFKLKVNYYINKNKIMLYTVSTLNIKRKFKLYLTALLASYNEQRDISASYYSLAKNKVKEFIIGNVSYAFAKKILENYINKMKIILSKPTLLHLALAEYVYFFEKDRNKKNIILKNKRKILDFNLNILENDNYFKLFYNELSFTKKNNNKDFYKDFFKIIYKY